jgi:serine/threonine protein kinase
VAPEAIQAARELDPRFDIYGLGTTLYFCATGKEAFPDRAGEQAQLRAQVLDTPEEPRARNPGISNELSRIIMKMMARDPANRYPRAREAVADLRKLQPVGGKDRGR